MCLEQNTGLLQVKAQTDWNLLDWSEGWTHVYKRLDQLLTIGEDANVWMGTDLLQGSLQTNLQELGTSMGGSLER